MIERSNATIKELIQKSLEINPKFDWVKHLDKLIENINNSNHRITGFTPNEIKHAFKNDDNVTRTENKKRKYIKRSI